MPVIFDAIRSTDGDVVFNAMRSMPGIISVICDDQPNVVIPGLPVTLEVNQLPETQGQVELQSADGLYQAILAITAWDSATGTVVVTGARGELPFGLADAVLILEDGGGAEFDRVTGLAIVAPEGTFWINGDAPSAASNSFFHEALSLPAGDYQLIWRDPNGVNPVVAASGEVTQADQEGLVYIQGYDYADGITSAEQDFYVRNLLAIHPASALAQGLAFLSAQARGIARPIGAILADARLWVSRVRLNASGKAPLYRTLVASENYRPEAGIKTFYKQPAEVLDFDVDLEAWLTSSLDQLQTFTVDVSKPELKLDSSYIVFGNRIKLWLSQGIERMNYSVSVKVVTKSGRVTEFDFRLVVRQFD